MHRHGITDIDGTIVKLSKIVPILQIEALGETAEEIIAEAKRQDNLGLDKNKTVYKIPISLQGVKACKKLTDEGFLVNIHLIYTLQQAYMAMEAGATYVCPLVGRLQDEGTDALQMVEQIVETVEHYRYDTKVMFSSVRNVEHIRNALNSKVHTITAPWKIIKQLTQNHFTKIGTQQFFEHTKLMTIRVREVISSKNPIIPPSSTIADALIKMTSDKFGAVAIADEKAHLLGVFTDGDLRRLISQQKIKDTFTEKVLDVATKNPISVDADSLLIDAQKIFSEKDIDELVVLSQGKAIGMLDIQDLMKL
ncbi:transaldolase [Elysia marginata]|uniref:Transaldolase n=1 Tax=Elysia marginata TaxID=1093978 RepID=A0AAV4FQW4_9GAST|nr:transaldolase [Elysia marginata]